MDAVLPRRLWQWLEVQPPLPLDHPVEQYLQGLAVAFAEGQEQQRQDPVGDFVRPAEHDRTQDRHFVGRRPAVPSPAQNIASGEQPCHQGAERLVRVPGHPRQAAQRKSRVVVDRPQRMPLHHTDAVAPQALVNPPATGVVHRPNEPIEFLGCCGHINMLIQARYINMFICGEPGPPAVFVPELLHYDGLR